MTRPLLLLVDDARDMGLIVGRLGSRCGCDVEHRLDAASAWQFLQDRRPDLMLLDVNLVGMSGPELCQVIRREPRLAALPIALFTREDLADDVASGLDAGADYLISKDLVVLPEAWALRLSEILGAVRSQRIAASLRSEVDEALRSVTRDWIAALNGAMRPPILSRLAPPVVRALLRRALSRVFVRSDTDCWLTPDGCALDPARVPPAAGRAAAELAAALAEQVWCMTGTADSAPFQSALVAAFPRISELLTRR
jgi:CheY-like chemotaxis protein